MPSETEVISCPACKHLLRVPADWLGQSVQCPECQATFAAPRRDGESLTDPVLITAAPSPPAAPKRPDHALWLPAFGLMLVGIVSLIVNGLTLVDLARDPVQFEELKKAEAENLAKMMGQDPQAGNNPGVNWRFFAATAGWGILCGSASFAGGIGMVLRRWYWLARVGSVMAIFNVAGCCCVPGALAGIWSWTLLRTEEGRLHFK